MALIGWAFAAAPGVAIVAAAFQAFERVERFLPVTDVILVAGFGVIVTGILVHASRAGSEDHETVLLLAVAAGLCFGLYTFGGWELSGAAAIFPLATTVACLGVTWTADATGRRKTALGLVTATGAVALALVPSVLIVVGLWNADVNQPELIREVGIAATLGTVASATFIGLLSATLPWSLRRQGAAPRRISPGESPTPRLNPR